MGICFILFIVNIIIKEHDQPLKTFSVFSAVNIKSIKPVISSNTNIYCPEEAAASVAPSKATESGGGRGESWLSASTGSTQKKKRIRARTWETS